MDFKDNTPISFAEALEALKQGKAVTRKEWTYDNVFIFMQVPTKVPFEVIQKMTSVPEFVKMLLINREEALEYHDHIERVDGQTNITSYAISVEDVLADDWYVLTENDY